MRKTIISAVAMLLASTIIAKANDDIVVTPYLGCYSKAEVETALKDGKFIIISEGHGPDGKVNEFWINSKGYTATVAFKKPKSNESVEQLCVLNVTKNTVIKSSPTALAQFVKDLVH